MFEKIKKSLFSKRNKNLKKNNLKSIKHSKRDKSPVEEKNSEVISTKSVIKQDVNFNKKRKKRKSSKQGIVGVNYRDDTQKWVVSMVKRGKQYAFGSYTDYDEAVQVRKQAEARYNDLDEFKKEIDIKIAERKKNTLKGFIPTLRNNTTTGIVGVSKSLNTWFAYIDKNKKKLSLGYYDTFEEAVKARKEAEANYDDIENHAKKVRAIQSTKRAEIRKKKRELEKAFKEKQKELALELNKKKITVRGVSLNKVTNKWEVNIQKLGIRYRFGAYDDYDDAVDMRRQAEARYYDIQAFHKEWLLDHPIKSTIEIPKLISHKELKETISYDPDNGTFILLKGRKKGSQIATHSLGRIYVHIKRKKLLAHKIAFYYMTGRVPKKIIFIDGNKENIKWNNLKEA